MMQLNVVVVFFALMAVPAQATMEDPKETPISKVVKLLQDLVGKIEEDAKAEQKTYDKFACWCEETLARKAAAIDAGKELIASTQREIVELKGRIGELGATLKQLEKEIAANEEARKEADEIRAKENEDYTAERTEAEQCIGAVESAIKVLQGAGTKKAMLETLQEAQVLSVVAGVKGVLRRVPASDALPESDLKLMTEFVEHPDKFMNSGFSGAQLDARSANPFGDYAPASTQIVGILKGMYDSFAANLETANAEEGDKQKSYEELHATALAEHATLTATLEAKTKEKADAEKALADAEILLKETTEQLAEDEKFFDTTKANCKAKAAEWAEETRLRTEELHGINKAIEILEGGMDTFESAHNTLLLQLSDSKVLSAQEKARTKAYETLKTTIKKNHGGLRLAFLAAEVQSGGHFDKIIKMIDKMIADLRVEEQEDIKAKDLCQNQENALDNQEEALEHEIKKKGEAKDRLEADKEEVADQIETIKDDIKLTKKNMEELLAARNEDVEAFKKALKDDVDAVTLLTQAIESLTAFYANNKIPLGLIQKKQEKQPYSGASSESGGIIAILEMLKEDLEKEIKVARATDAAAQKRYLESNGELKGTLKTQEKSETTLDGEHADLEGKITDHEGEIANHEEMKGNTRDEREAMKPSCDWVKTKFEPRREKRKAEIEGLQQAKSILAGAPALFLQRA